MGAMYSMENNFINIFTEPLTFSRDGLAFGKGLADLDGPPLGLSVLYFILVFTVIKNEHSSYKFIVCLHFPRSLKKCDHNKIDNVTNKETLQHIGVV